MHRKNGGDKEIELQSGNENQVIVNKTITSLFEDIDAYVLETEKKFADLHEKKENVDKKARESTGNMASDMTSSLLGVLQHGFYSKIDFNEVLAEQKIKIAKKLKASIQELITDAPTTNTKPVDPLDLLSGVSYLLLLAKEQNQAISSGFTSGTAGKLDSLLERQIKLIKEKYPQVFEKAVSIKNSF